MFNSISELTARFVELGASSAFCKLLAENDNSKQQIYLGGSFEVVQMLPFSAIEATSNGQNSTYKAKLDFYWVGQSFLEKAVGAQMILYPQYPEVRLSGFLRGCKLAPSELLRPVPANQRKFNNQHDGRVMFFAVTGDGRVLAYLASAGDAISVEFMLRLANEEFKQQSIFYQLHLGSSDSKTILLRELARIRDFGWQPSIRLDKFGKIIPYNARNGGGYTLEALLGIIPNGRSEPDFMGWEIKSYSQNRITLMTPEPDGGVYAENGVKAFVKIYGHPTGNDTLYFTGTHKANIRNSSTGLTLNVRGFNPTKRLIDDVSGAVELLNDRGECAASWSFSELMIGWNKKHAQAAYVKYESEKNKQKDPAYRYYSPALLGEGTDFNKYLSALSSGLIIFDPGSKVTDASTHASTVKARSQFRVSLKQLSSLYQKLEAVDF